MREPVVAESRDLDGALGWQISCPDLRAELAEVSKRVESDSLKLEVEEVTVSLDVAATIARKGEVPAVPLLDRIT
jgi:hypothetical protein